MAESERPIAVGDRALCGCTGFWRCVGVRRLNEDGSFDVDLEGHSERFPPPTWHGVTRSELIPIDAQLERAEAYRLLREGGLPYAVPPLAAFYWNQVRMGGRSPREIPRSVTLADAYAALGVADELDARARVKLSALERRLGIVVPSTLRALVTCAGIGRALLESHPNQPSLLPFEQWWSVSSEHGELVAFMDSHQASHAWAVALKGDASVYFLPDADEKTALLAAEDVAFFIWDLAQTGLAWQQAMVREDPRLRRTDIGIAAPRRGFWSFFW